MKKIICIITSLIMIIGACGCMNSFDGGGNSKNDKVDMMINYINEKYQDDTFEFVSMSGGHIGSNVTKILVSSEKFPESEIRVICTSVDGVDTFTDTYLNIKFEEETREYIEDIFEKQFGDNCYIKYIPDDLSCTIDGSELTTFEEYIKEESSHIYFSAVVSGEIDDIATMNEVFSTMFSDIVFQADIYFFNALNVNTDDEMKSAIESKEYTKKVYIEKQVIDEISIIEWTENL